MTNDQSKYFYIKDCTLSPVVTGIVASGLVELREQLTTIPVSCLYHHFLGNLIWRHFETREYHNDFAIWAKNSLNDRVLAERLSIIDPTDSDDLELLRSAIISILDTRLLEIKQELPQSKSDCFHFVRSQIIVLSTPYVLQHPSQLQDIIPQLSINTIFYHFIDAICRAPLGHDDFSAWLTSFGTEYDGLIQQLKDIDYYFIPLSQLQHRLHGVFNNYFSKNVRAR